ncbi:uncharacterized protein TM35_000064800 [Trypanosoma theileri]|uniref:Uncharacterized protein n=1 Tax=Trypanosoma theileri TaxID=67003 RepID=A0A1X0P3L7_9TRYP|nr:uncharacterized protein TM35_000064800 [Trypanosoma theileri]ORC91475.1 hypothetical protein TM35_000064800 [Trypanosoma theileri]
MLDVLLSSFVLLVVALITFAGAAIIVRGGFFRLAVGALVMALLLSILLSSCAVLLLQATSDLPQNILFVSVIRAVLGAVAQPTISGIVLLAMLFVGASSASRVCGLIEDIQILLDAHKAFLDTEVSQEKSKK